VFAPIGRGLFVEDLIVTQTPKNFSSTKPILKPKLRQRILSIHPQPPIEDRLPPELVREKITLTEPAVRVKKSLKQSIDYNRLTPTQQLRWDVGSYGSIELKTIKGHQYYYQRWYDPHTKKYRSTYLAKDWDKAIAKLKKLTQTKN
jgi:hypothetical protein